MLSKKQKKNMFFFVSCSLKICNSKGESLKKSLQDFVTRHFVFGIAARDVFQRRVRRLQFPRAKFVISACEVDRLATSKIVSNCASFDDTPFVGDTFLTWCFRLALSNCLIIIAEEKQAIFQRLGIQSIVRAIFRFLNESF